ncbi:hypothetical protein AMS68_004075 [Peltaster fructicola]|uniref:Uncharacterized protein n=1 Tax=Peltaster fructicola TaxID=286661 RepID=A0A6H0XVB8_9PEZI|nr:hypothetical protein AMS68_004075 [Peltaster fructicola]
MSHNFGWLSEQAAEDALHAERLLFIEEKPFHRVTRRLLADDSTLRNIPKQQATPPPEGEEGEDGTGTTALQPFSREKFWEDVLVDFAALQSSITRIQLIHASNERERERYANEKSKILASAQAVRDNTVVLREQLSEAQSILQLRKGYDELAGRILDDKKLKSRDEAKQSIATLEQEIEELQAEGTHIESLWIARKEGFERVVAEGKAFLQDIKGIKDQPDEDLKGEDEDMIDGEDEYKGDSTVGTPRPDGSNTPRAESGNMTPLSGSNNDDLDDAGQEEQRTQSKLRETELAEEVTPSADVEPTQESSAVNGSSQAVEPSQETLPDPVDDNVVEEDDNVVVETMDET